MPGINMKVIAQFAFGALIVLFFVVVQLVIMLTPEGASAKNYPEDSPEN